MGHWALGPRGHGAMGHLTLGPWGQREIRGNWAPTKRGGIVLVGVDDHRLGVLLLLLARPIALLPPLLLAPVLFREHRRMRLGVVAPHCAALGRRDHPQRSICRANEGAAPRGRCRHELLHVRPQAGARAAQEEDGAEHCALPWRWMSNHCESKEGGRLHWRRWRWRGRCRRRRERRRRRRWRWRWRWWFGMWRERRRRERRGRGRRWR